MLAREKILACYPGLNQAGFPEHHNPTDRPPDPEDEAGVPHYFHLVQLDRLADILPIEMVA